MPSTREAPNPKRANGRADFHALIIKYNECELKVIVEETNVRNQKGTTYVSLVASAMGVATRNIQGTGSRLT